MAIYYATPNPARMSELTKRMQQEGKIQDLLAGGTVECDGKHYKIVELAPTEFYKDESD